MRLLVVTQAIDENDTQLGFFVEWVRALAQRYAEVHVACLKRGTYTLPKNVQVYSLGKEKMAATRMVRLRYAVRFLLIVWRTRRAYDAVFVHMNQEYILIAGWLWWLLGKRVYLWRNHYAGSVFTDSAMLFCEKVFYTSRFSYTAKFAHAKQMPVGCDTKRFTLAGEREARSVVSLGRIAPSKRIEVFVEALRELHRDGIQVHAHVYGDALPEDAEYMASLRTDATAEFHGGVPHCDVPKVLQRASIFVNLSKSGMLDKTIFEAAACGCLVLARSEDYHAFTDDQLRLTDDSAGTLAQKLRVLLSLPEDEVGVMRTRLREMVERTHSLDALMNRLFTEMV
jgi:glycosyltransferase involved in cell wall biosynthesis